MALSLISLKNGVAAIIQHIKLHKDLTKKLMLTGIYQGQVVKIIQKHKNGSVIVEVNDNTVVMGRDLASHVFASYIENYS